MDHSPPGSLVHGILQGRILEWDAMPFSKGLPDPGIEPTSLMFPALAGRFFTTTFGSPIILWGTYNFVDFSSHFLRINSQA